MNHQKVAVHAPMIAAIVHSAAVTESVPRKKVVIHVRWIVETALIVVGMESAVPLKLVPVVLTIAASVTTAATIIVKPGRIAPVVPKIAANVLHPVVTGFALRKKVVIPVPRIAANANPLVVTASAPIRKAAIPVRRIVVNALESATTESVLQLKPAATALRIVEVVATSVEIMFVV